MRARLAHTLSFWLVGSVLVSVLAMGAVMAWNLRAGFGAYMEARDVERLETFAKVASEALEHNGGSQALRDRRITLPMLLEEAARRDGVPLAARPPEPSLEEDMPPPGPPPGDPGHSPPGNGDSFGARVMLLVPDDSPLPGVPMPTLADTPPFGTIQRDIYLGGKIVATARLRVLRRAPDIYEVRFLQSQYYGIAGTAALLMLVALLCAWWLSRQWAQPLAAVQEATARIARGELSARIKTRYSKGRSDEFGDLVRNVNHMAESLQRIEGARRRWIADMSHELRTPLTVLRGELDALIDHVRPLNPAAIESLREEVMQMSRMVEDLHLLAIADLQTLPCQYVECDALEILKRVQRRFETRATERGLQLSVDPSEGTPGVDVYWDMERIEQLLGNLVENSLRYTDAPGRIELTLRLQPEHICIDVDDSAPGVAADDLDRLFEPLFRADDARSRHTGGSGLGLAICRAIAAAHGGRITATNSHLGGLRVRVSIPREPPVAIVEAGAVV